MRRLIKYIPILMSMLCSVFMFSVGFSSWIMIKPIGAPGGGSFSAHEVRELVKHNNMEMFHYSSLSFSTKDANDKTVELQSGTISAYYILYINDCNGEYKGTDSSGKQIDWKLSMTLSYSNISGTPEGGLFVDIDKDTYYRKVTSAVTAIPSFTLGSDQALSSNNFATGAIAVEHSLTNNGTSIVLSIDSSWLPASGTYFLKVDYIFDIPKNTSGGIPSNFRHMFGQYLKDFENDKTEFITTAEVEKVTKEVSGQ